MIKRPENPYDVRLANERDIFKQAELLLRSLAWEKGFTEGLLWANVEKSEQIQTLVRQLKKENNGKDS